MPFADGKPTKPAPQSTPIPARSKSNGRLNSCTRGESSMMKKPPRQMPHDLTAQDQTGPDMDMPDTLHGDSGSTPSPEQREARMDRIQDYQAHALHKDDHLEANLGSLNAGLMRIGITVSRRWHDSLSSIAEKAVASGCAPGYHWRAQATVSEIRSHAT
jgi:hypothetical protein